MHHSCVYIMQYHNKRGHLTCQVKMPYTRPVEHIHSFVYMVYMACRQATNIIPNTLPSSLPSLPSLPPFPPSLPSLPSSLPSLPPTFPPQIPLLTSLPPSFLPSPLSHHPSLLLPPPTGQRRAMAWMLWREGETPSGGILGGCLEPASEWVVHVA